MFFWGPLLRIPTTSELARISHMDVTGLKILLEDSLGVDLSIYINIIGLMLTRKRDNENSKIAPHEYTP